METTAKPAKKPLLIRLAPADRERIELAAAEVGLNAQAWIVQAAMKALNRKS